MNAEVGSVDDIDNESSVHWLWFSCFYNIGLVKQHKLLSEFNDAGSVWNADTADLRLIRELSDDDIARLRDAKLKDEAYKKLEWINKNDIRVISFRNADYPVSLKVISLCPPVLFVKGALPCGETIGIVGSRNPTSYGSQVGYSLAYQLAGHGIAVISGMAKGIDTCAHAGALKACGKTAAVLGCGIDKPYPSENKSLMERISSSGAVITEYPPGTPPIPYNFPARNRIISGLSRFVLIIEAGKRSGALITADCALEQGKDVFALPGNITSKQSIGTNRLIRDGAKIVTCVDDILEEYKITGKKQSIDSPELLKHMYSSAGELDTDELRVLGYLAPGPQHIDTIAGKLGFTVSRTGSMLLLMELKGIVEQLPGYFYKLCISSADDPEPRSE